MQMDELFTAWVGADGGGGAKVQWINLSAEQSRQGKNRKRESERQKKVAEKRWDCVTCERVYVQYNWGREEAKVCGIKMMKEKGKKGSKLGRKRKLAFLEENVKIQRQAMRSCLQGPQTLI